MSSFNGDPSRDRRRRFIFVAVVVLALIVGGFVGRALSPDAEDRATSSPPEGSSTPADAVARSEAGAVEAATELARVMASPTSDSAAYVAAMTSLAAPGWEDRARELADNTSEFVRDRYGPDGRVELQPVRYRLESFSPEAATVDIWGVVLATGSKVRGIEESWITASIDLEWVEAEWKVAAQASRGGPTPELLRTDESIFAQEILDEFIEYTDAPKP